MVRKFFFASGLTNDITSFCFLLQLFDNYHPHFDFTVTTNHHNNQFTPYVFGQNQTNGEFKPTEGHQNKTSEAFIAHSRSRRVLDINCLFGHHFEHWVQQSCDCRQMHCVLADMHRKPVVPMANTYGGQTRTECSAQTESGRRRSRRYVALPLVL